jgi:hypothetical protein
MTRLTIGQFFDPQKLSAMQNSIREAEGPVVVYGTGASEVAQSWDLLIYADMARWEIQQRMRRQPVANLGVNNHTQEFSRMYKRAYFVDWRVADRLKRKLLDRLDFLLDTNAKANPKMASGDALRAGLRQTAQHPFRVVPFFDPGPWGGQWMKEVCDLDRSAVNYAWCFDCVPEENSLLLNFGDITLEIPAINLVFYQPKQLLGENVYARFGAEFPIRFDFLDTMDGGNLSLQVHPLTEYIREHFGMFYTQDESYYMLDVKEDAFVYLGLKAGVQPDQMIAELEAAQNSTAGFDAEKHVERRPVRSTARAKTAWSSKSVPHPTFLPLNCGTGAASASTDCPAPSISATEKKISTGRVRRPGSNKTSSTARSKSRKGKAGGKNAPACMKPNLSKPGGIGFTTRSVTTRVETCMSST